MTNAKIFLIATMKKKDELTKQEINNDNLALIAHLRKQLKIANEDRKNLMYQIKNIKIMDMKNCLDFKF